MAGSRPPRARPAGFDRSPLDVCVDRCLEPLVGRSDPRGRGCASGRRRRSALTRRRRRGAPQTSSPELRATQLCVVATSVTGQGWHGAESAVASGNWAAVGTRDAVACAVPDDVDEATEDAAAALADEAHAPPTRPRSKRDGRPRTAPPPADARSVPSRPLARRPGAGSAPSRCRPPRSRFSSAAPRHVSPMPALPRAARPHPPIALVAARMEQRPFAAVSVGDAATSGVAALQRALLPSGGDGTSPRSTRIRLGRSRCERR
jgi:hypothetical protein